MHTPCYSYEMWRVSLHTGEHLKSSFRASLGFFWLPSSYLANLKSKVFSLPTEIGYQMQFRLCLEKLFDIFYRVAFFLVPCCNAVSHNVGTGVYEGCGVTWLILI